MERKQIWAFSRALYIFLFSRSKFSGGCGRSSSVPDTADSWLDLRTHMSVRDGSGKKKSGWREGHGLAALSQLCLRVFQQDPGWASKAGSRFSESSFPT